MLKIRIAEWLFAIATIAAIIIGFVEYEPELVKSLADKAKQILIQ